ncbi:MAG: M48 family metallopeptidase [Nitrospirota bacterium]|nr:MAG: M48 family metallopeptidase [Nitrospirota bacterium]
MARYLIIVIACILVISCTTVPITGRQQLKLISSDEINSMSFREYDKFIKKSKVVEGTYETEMVKRVGESIGNAVERFFSDLGRPDMLKGYKWEFSLIDDRAVNAWAMPGGKVVVYSGILPVAVDESGLAVVIGHEIAHAVANHGNERMSQGLLVQMGGVALSVALSERPKETRQLYMTAFGVGSTLGIMLPYSRVHETEADQLGLIFMAMAGYDPRVAIKFWERMASMKDSQTPEFLSTHPTPTNRIREINQFIPQALEYYRP